MRGAVRPETRDFGQIQGLSKSSRASDAPWGVPSAGAKTILVGGPSARGPKWVALLGADFPLGSGEVRFTEGGVINCLSSLSIDIILGQNDSGSWPG